jgi:hypothetical protein
MRAFGLAEMVSQLYYPPNQTLVFGQRDDSHQPPVSSLYGSLKLLLGSRNIRR